jgi:hypothetical protein
MARRLNDDEKYSIRSQIRTSSSDISSILENFLNRELSEDTRKSLLSSYQSIKESNQFSETEDLSSILATLSAGSAPPVDKSSSKSAGEAWELIFITIIQNLFVDSLPGDVVLQLSGKTPDLPELELDLKKSTKDGGISSSTSSNMPMVVDAFFQRLNGIEHDILMFRFALNGDRWRVSEFFIERTHLVDGKVYDRFQSAVKTLMVDDFPDSLIRLRSGLLHALANFLSLSRPKKMEFNFVVVDCILFSTFGPWLRYENKRELRRFRTDDSVISKLNQEEKDYFNSTNLNSNIQYYNDRFSFSSLEDMEFQFLPDSFLTLVEKDYYSDDIRELYSPLLNRKDLTLQQRFLLYMTPFLVEEYRKSTDISREKIDILVNRILDEQIITKKGNLTTKGLELHITFKAPKEEE